MGWISAHLRERIPDDLRPRTILIIRDSRVGDVLYIAMAGPHQLWRYDITTGEVAIHSGSGREGLVDAGHASAQLAQPSGITTDGTTLYFADSEASAIRASDGWIPGLLLIIR